MKRRDFVQKSISAGFLLGAGLPYGCGKAKRKLNILVLGGTFFVGPAIVNAALRNNHSVTLFNRGMTNPNLFPELRHIKGDREKGIKAYDQLKKDNWDIVIDVWPEKSLLVDEATSSLMDSAKHYIFISSIAVYADFQQVGLHEQSRVVDLKSNKNNWDYPEEKLAAEEFVRARFQNRHTVLRAGPIKGWRDPAFDLLYWCVKLNRDDEVIAPGSGMDPLQFIDVNDVGQFAIMASEQNIRGTFNVVGPKKEPLLWRDFLNDAKKHFNSQTILHWAGEDFLASNQVASFTDLPLWAPRSEDKGFMQISNTKLIQSGYEFTPIFNTLDDSIRWFKSTQDHEIKFGTNETNIGLERSRELDLIVKLKG